MKKLILNITLSISPCPLIAQNSTPSYSNLILKAESLFKEKEYKNSALAYSEAFKSLGWKGQQGDRYNAACAWSLANIPDSAFFQLNKIVVLWNYTSYEQVKNDSDFKSLHTDKRWDILLETIKSNKEKAEKNFNKPLIALLDSIFNEDQSYRLNTDSIYKKYGYDSAEMKNIWKTINERDSTNLIQIEKIIDKYGWLGQDVIGEKGNATLFLVIQHANLTTQEKYLPIMKEAVKNGKASGSELALLIDRVEMRNGRPQIYGSQIQTIDGKNIIYKIADEINVNKRRSEVGLQPLEEYVKHWDIDYKLPTH